MSFVSSLFGGGAAQNTGPSASEIAAQKALDDQAAADAATKKQEAYAAGAGLRGRSALMGGSNITGVSSLLGG
jgi:hypothetical protein